MTNALATQNGITPGELMERVIAAGDISRMDPGDRAKYVVKVCESAGLNPLTKPFDLITLNGKLTLYATKGATDQLRKIHGITLKVVGEKQIQDVWQVTVEATAPDGRTDTDIGVVTLANLKGDALANALMKALTKAKRRVTLSICGLGVLDESEFDTIPARAFAAEPTPRQQDAPTPTKSTHSATPVTAEVVDAETGEIQPGFDPVKANQADIKAEIVRLANDLGWTPDNIAAFAAARSLNVRSRAGSLELISGMQDLLDNEYADDEEDYEAAQPALLDADTTPIDRWA